MTNLLGSTKLGNRMPDYFVIHCNKRWHRSSFSASMLFLLTGSASISLHLNGHFSTWTWVSRFYWS